MQVKIMMSSYLSASSMKEMFQPGTKLNQMKDLDDKWNTDVSSKKNWNVWDNQNWLLKEKWQIKHSTLKYKFSIDQIALFQQTAFRPSSNINQVNIDTKNKGKIFFEIRKKTKELLNIHKIETLVNSNRCNVFSLTH